MSDTHRLRQFLAWFETFDPQHVHNEDDVVTKFVIPFFLHLGYPETSRRGQYGIDAYARGKKVGNTHAADQVYFSVPDTQSQGPDTSLVVVETKAPKETDLDNATKQARFYGAYLTPPFLVVTNGQHLRVLQRRRYHSDVVIVDDAVPALRDPAQATSLYQQLNFEVVRHMKEHGDNMVMHAQYVRLQATLERYPDVQEVLEHGDFEAEASRQGHSVTVVRPKVAMVGELPIAFEEGGCSIEFSNVLRRGLTIQLSHTQIIRDLLLGLNTPPAWGARLFLTPLDDGTYGAQLGGTATILSQAEAIDLCAAVDEVGAAYKCSLVEVETLLETWEFQPVETEYGRGFQLMSLPSELWRQMHAFVEGHDYGDGNSPWHIFERFGPAIRICANPQHLDSAILWPIYDGSWSRGAVHVIYLAPQWALERMREGADFDWKSLIGPVGTWTAAFTKQWLQQKLIPMVRGEHKPQPAAVKRSEAFSDLDQTRPNYRPFELLRSARDFVPYLYDVHHWIARYPTKRLPAALLRPFYVAFADLVGGADEKILASHYVLSRLGTIELTCDRHPKPAVEMLEKGSVQQRSAASVDSLHWNVERIGSTEYEATPNAAYLTRVFTYIIETADLSPNQAQLNAAKHQLRLLWEQRRFEERYVFRALGFTVTA